MIFIDGWADNGRRIKPRVVSGTTVKKNSKRKNYYKLSSVDSHDLMVYFNAYACALIACIFWIISLTNVIIIIEYQEVTCPHKISIKSFGFYCTVFFS